MKVDNSDAIVLTLLKDAVESEGCRLEEVDLESLTIKIDGPDEVVGNCAKAVVEILD